MKIIISPAKKMEVDIDTLTYRDIPKLIDKTEIILNYLKELDYEKLKSIWKCSDKIARLNYERIKNIDLYSNLTPSILSFNGLQYKYMGSNIFSYDEFEYIQEKLRILSGFYGILRPFDGVVPYRLEMQSKLKGKNIDSLYDFWGESIAKDIFSESKCIINLASKEYSKCITDYLDESIKFITCIFGEIKDGKLIEKGTLAKMARGEMVRFMAEEKIQNEEEIKRFNRLDYIYSDDLSDESTYVFLKNN